MFSGNDQLACDVPSGLVHDHDDELVGVTLGHFLQEQRHRLGADPGQHETVHHAVVRADGAECVQVLALPPRAHDRPAAAWSPAAPRRAQQPEAALVLELQPHAAALLSLAQDLLAYLATPFS